MILVKQEIKSCCGSGKSLLLETDKPIKKYQIKVFRDKNYFIPENFYQSGLFYVQKGRLIATTTFGSTRFNIKNNGPNADVELTEFESLLEQAINL